tara:strand:- start:71 stop:2362 length:2292 start_codon:yes stop_codon:yes gene_type:complete
MAKFDPDAYLKEPAPATAFDPDEYLGAKPQTRGTVPEEPTLAQRVLPALVGYVGSQGTMGLGISRGVGDVMFGAQTLLGKGAQAIGMTETGRRLQEDAAQRMAREAAAIAPYEAAYPDQAATGQFIGQTIPLLGAGRVMAAPLRAAGAPGLATAVQTGGFQGPNVLARATGGAALGGASGAVLSGGQGTDTLTGAGLGALIPTVAAPALSALAGTAPVRAATGFVKDLGRGAQLKAGELARAAAGGDLAAIKAANAAAPNMPAELAAAGINRDTYFALLDEAAKKDPNGFVRAMRAAEAPEHINELAKLAGGPTQTASRESVQASKNTLNAITGPMMETELKAAGTAGEFIKTKGPQIYQKYDSMVDALQQTGQMYAEANAIRLAANQKRAELVKKLNSPTPGWVSQKTIDKLDQEIAVLDQNAAKAKQAVEEMNAIKFQRQDEGEFAVRQVQSLALHGLKPIDTDLIVSNIAQKIENPKIGVSDESKKVLLAVADKIQEWTAKGGGYIDPAALHEIRKTYVNEVIQKELAGRDPSYIARQAAKVTGELRPLIDDAIEKAGGTDWRKALDTHAKGMQQLEQRTMSAQLMDMYDKAQANPTEFLRLVRGNNPDAVEKVFGPGSFNLAQQMGEKMRPLEKIASEVERRQFITKMAKEGRAALADIAKNQQGVSLRLPFFNRTASVMNKAADILEGKIDRKTLDILIEGAKSGKNMNDLLNAVPTRERSVILDALSKVGAPGVVGAAQLSTNKLAPEKQPRNALIQ